MAKDTKIDIRIDYGIKQILKDISKQYKVTISGLVNMFIQQGLVNGKDVTVEIKKKLQSHLAELDKRELCRRVYIKKNMYTRVMDVAMSDYFISQRINMKAINTIIDSYVKIFESYDDETKKDIGTDFKLVVRQLKSRNFLMNQSQNMSMIKYIGRK